MFFVFCVYFLQVKCPRDILVFEQEVVSRDYFSCQLSAEVVTVSSCQQRLSRSPDVRGGCHGLQLSVEIVTVSSCQRRLSRSPVVSWDCHSLQLSAEVVTVSSCQLKLSRSPAVSRDPLSVGIVIVSSCQRRSVVSGDCHGLHAVSRDPLSAGIVIVSSCWRRLSGSPAFSGDCHGLQQCWRVRQRTGSG